MALCTACHLPTNVPAHLPPPNAQGMCAACQQMTAPNFIERIATNQMPACFTPTRETIARMASHIMLLRAALGVTSVALERQTHSRQRFPENLDIVAENKKLLPRGGH